MNKTKAFELLGPTAANVGKAVGCSGSAVRQWPEVLPRRIEDRVLAALARKHLPAEILASIAEDAAASANHGR